MKTVTITAEGETEEDLALAIDQAKEKILEGNVQGRDRGEAGGYGFIVSGGEEEDEDPYEK